MMRFNLAIPALLFALLTPAAFAGPRAQRWSGFDLGVGTNPLPSIGGLTLGFNIEDDVRISAGAGTTGSWTTYGVDAKIFVSPDAWSFYFGAGLNYLTGTPGTVLLWDFDFEHTLAPIVEAGIDFQSDVGIHVGFNAAGSVVKGVVLLLPGVTIGWYF